MVVVCCESYCWRLCPVISSSSNCQLVNLPTKCSLRFVAGGGKWSDGMLMTYLSSPNCLVLAGLSLYFEDGHDDLDDCEYSWYFNLLTKPH